MGRRIVGIVVERALITVPVVQPVDGCVEFDPSDCCGSGSGSGSGACGAEECVTACDQCGDGMSARWELTVTGYDEPIILCHIQHPDDGNYCQFVSVDLAWRLYYDYGDEVWLLTNFDTGFVWFIDGADWVCLDENILESTEPDVDSVLATPVFDCSEVSYNCVDGACVLVAGAGGTYATLSECVAACGGGTDVTTTCVPETAKSVMIATVVGRGNCACYTGAFPISWTGTTAPWVWIGPGGVCGATQSQIVLTCSGGNWIVRIECPSGSLSLFQSGQDADSTTPFSLTFDGGGGGISNSGGSTCCTSGVDSITITVP